MECYDFNVSGNGHMSLPAPTRRAWGCHEGGEISIADLGDAVFVTQPIARYDLIEAIYPQSDLTRRGIDSLSAHNGTRNLTSNDERQPRLAGLRGKPFTTQRISPSGQFNITASIRDRWGIPNGGVVRVNDLDTALVVKPADDQIVDLGEVVPLDLLRDQEWLQNLEELQELLTPLKEHGYRDWCAEIGQKLLKFSLTGEGTPEYLTTSPQAETVLGRKIGEAVIEYAMESALTRVAA